MNVRAGYTRILVATDSTFSNHVPPTTPATVIDQSVVDMFVARYAPEAPRIAARTAIELARRIVPERFTAPSMEPDPHGPLLCTDRDHLRRVRGLEPKTCEGLLLVARRILYLAQRAQRAQPGAQRAQRGTTALRDDGRARGRSRRIPSSIVPQHPDTNVDYVVCPRVFRFLLAG